MKKSEDHLLSYLLWSVNKESSLKQLINTVLTTDKWGLFALSYYTKDKKSSCGFSNDPKSALVLKEKHLTHIYDRPQNDKYFVIFIELVISS